ncbi:MAG: hypothetical protein KME54_13375 [Tolypothrix brevis GSE-NOS-MK-07-07A]|nr:hypothetical protein [Tolypothrix brevis GSE-NOS-MK-07-07A]
MLYIVETFRRNVFTPPERLYSAGTSLLRRNVFTPPERLYSAGTSLLRRNVFTTVTVFLLLLISP